MMGQLNWMNLYLVIVSLLCTFTRRMSGKLNVLSILALVFSLSLNVIFINNGNVDFLDLQCHVWDGVNCDPEKINESTLRPCQSHESLCVVEWFC